MYEMLNGEEGCRLCFEFVSVCLLLICFKLPLCFPLCNFLLLHVLAKLLLKFFVFCFF